MPQSNWCDVGAAEELALRSLAEVDARGKRLALIHRAGRFTALDGACNHVGGPLGQGTLDGDYLVCPWHYWKFHVETGEGEPGFEEDRVPSYPVRVANGRVEVDLANATPRRKKPHERHPLARKVQRAPGPSRVVGIATTARTAGNPRYSTSSALLGVGLEHAAARGCETRTIELDALRFRACEGFYSKSARACTWPCSITQMDPEDELTAVYEALVHWGDVVLVATPIRWGAASSLYFKMVERMNCIQNQQTIANRVLLKDKVAGFVITGGQDNVQGVAGQMLGFFAEIGFHFPCFPYVAHSRGWDAEDMENNVRSVQESESLREGVRALVDRAVDLSELLVSGKFPDRSPSRGGRKAHKDEAGR